MVNSGNKFGFPIIRLLDGVNPSGSPDLPPGLYARYGQDYRICFLRNSHNITFLGQTPSWSTMTPPVHFRGR